MSALDDLKTRIDAAIYSNTEQNISGDGLQTVLDDMVDTMGVSVSQNTETGKEELLIGGSPALIVDNEPELRSQNLVNSNGVANADLEEAMKTALVAENKVKKRVRHTYTSGYQTLWSGINFYSKKTYKVKVSIDEAIASIVYMSIMKSDDTCITETYIPAGETSKEVTLNPTADYLNAYIRLSSPIMDLDIIITPTVHYEQEISDNSINNSKLVNNTLESGKISPNTKGRFDSPFGFGFTNDGFQSIRDIKIITTDITLLNSVFSVYRLKFQSGAFYFKILKDGETFQEIELNSFIPTLDTDVFTIRKDDKTIVRVVIKWSLLPDGTNITETRQIRSEKIILKKNLNEFAVASVFTVHPCISESIIKASVKCLSEKDVNATYYIYIFKKVGTTFFMRLYKTVNGVSKSQDVEATLTTGNETITGTAFNVDFVIDCSKIPNNTDIRNYALAYIINRETIEPANAKGAFLGVDTIKSVYSNVCYVDCRVSASSGNNFKTIKEACEYVYSISANKPQEQYQIVIKPGVYDEMGIKVPPYTHIHGSLRDSVIVTDRSFEGALISSCIFDFGTNANVAWKTPGVCGKISNLTIKSVSGSYCFHADNDGGIIADFENVHFQFEYNSTANSYYVVGAAATGSGMLIHYKSCLFSCIGGNAKGNISSHNSKGQSYGNCLHRFDKCQFINCNFNFDNIGAYGRYDLEFNDCVFTNGGRLYLSEQNLTTLEDTFLAVKSMWNVIGGNNKNFVINVPNNGYAVMLEADNVGSNTINLNGSIVDALFGGVIYRKGGTNLKAQAIGTYQVADEQVNSHDVYQMWKRLGNCSVNNKTMKVSLNGGEEQTVTLTQNYLDTKPSEETILTEINSQLLGCSIKKINITDKFSIINTTEKETLLCNDNADILKFSCVTKNGSTCSAGDTNVYGIALADTAYGDLMPVWVGKGVYIGLEDGNYAVGSNGQLTLSESNIIGYSADGVFYLNNKD